MEHSLFDFDEYKAYVLARIETAPNAGRGMRAQMAQAMGCQVAYVSHVLAGDRHFSLEQAEALSRFLALRPDEAEFFVLLVEFNRAGTKQLAQLLGRQLAKRRADFRHLKNRVATHAMITPEDQALYYSSWQYQAVRMLLTLPDCRTAPTIARRLTIPLERVTEILVFFLEKGLARETPRGYETTAAEIHLGSDSLLISKLHSNWRVQTLQALDRKNPDDLHYSGAVTLSHSDFQKVREIWVKSILESHKVIRTSKEQRLCVLAADFYEL